MSALPLLVLASATLIILGKADTLLFDRLRANFGDLAAPVLELVSRPAASVDSTVDRVHDVFALYTENARLREENARLMQWQQAAQNLRAENQRLKQLLNLTPDPQATFVSAKVVANSGGAFLSTWPSAGPTGGAGVAVPAMI